MGNSSIELTVENVFLHYNNKKINLNSVKPEDLKTIENYLLYITYFELISKNNKISFSKKEVESMKSSGPGCSWWNTLTVTGIRRTIAAAEADLWAATIQAVNNGTLQGCRSIGGVEIDDFGIIKNASQSLL